MKKFLNLSNWLMALGFIGAVTFSSCQKNVTTNPQDDSQELAATANVAENDASAETEYDDVFNITMNVQSSDAGEDIGIGGSGSFGIYGRTTDNGRVDSSSRCFTVTVTPNTLHVFPKTVTIDFGTGCLGRDGKLRKGKIVTMYTGPMVIPGSKATTTFVNYSVDTFKIEGTHSVENVSTSNQLALNVKVVDGKITNTNSGKWKRWNSNKTITQTEGNGTPAYALDDVFKVTGSANGSNSEGAVWTATITEPLIKKFICPWIVKGKVQITRNNNLAILDYGNGDCDNHAVITINGTAYNITLH